jgi:DNA-directed RNA polymerase II subunit RPB1
MWRNYAPPPSLPRREITAVQLHITSEHDIRVGSAALVTNNKVINNDTKMPEEGGIYDIRMGTGSYENPCGTCFRNKTTCPGHHGHLDLNYPVYNVIFKKEILRWLKIVCINCGNLHVETMKGTKNLTFREAGTSARKSCRSNPTCSKCGFLQPIFEFKKAVDEKWTIIGKIYDSSKTGKGGRESVKETIYMPHHIRDIFSRVSIDATYKFSSSDQIHPSLLVLSTIPITPNTIRLNMPKTPNGRSANHELTTLTRAIVSANKELYGMSEPEKHRDKVNNLLMAYSNLIKDSPTTQVTAIAPRIPQKQGIIRRTIMASRTSACTRSVITCNDRHGIGAVGVPLSTLTTVRKQEVVTEYNFDKINVLFHNTSYPRVRRIKRGNQLMDVDRMPEKVLQLGDVVFRDIIGDPENGDFIILNRQPALEIGCLSSHRVVVNPNSNSISLSVSSCAPYNADFDGDEMNGYIVNGSMAETEAKLICSIHEHFISHKLGVPLLGAFQDTLSLSFIMTEKFSMDGYVFMQIMNGLTARQLSNARYDVKNSYTSYDLTSSILPEDLNYVKTANFYQERFKNIIKYDETDVNVVIKQGRHLQGRLDAASIKQGKANSIFHIINNTHGPKKAVDAIECFQGITAHFGLFRAQTITIKDVMVSDAAMAKINSLKRQLFQRYVDVFDELIAGKIVPPIGVEMHDHLEELLLNALEPSDEFINVVFSDLDAEQNGINQLVSAGSKGSYTNILAMHAIIGSQNIFGQRPKNHSARRASVYGPRDSFDPCDSGFIDTNLHTGIGLQSMIWTSQQTRAELINTALNTSIAGAWGRDLIKNFESDVVDNSYCLVKNAERIIQTIFGETGADPRFVEMDKFQTVKISEKELKEKFYFKAGGKLADKEFEQIKEDRELYRKIFRNIELVNGINALFSDTQKTTVNITRIISDVITIFEDSAKTKLNIPMAVEQVQELCETLPYRYQNEYREMERSRIPSHLEKACVLNCILIRSKLCLAELVRKNITNDMLDEIARRIKNQIRRSLIAYGTAGGIITAQAMSEPLTQLVIDSKHRSGAGGGSGKGDALSRLTEIYRAKDTDSMKDPYCIVVPLAEYREDKRQVQKIANNIEVLNMRRFTISWSLFYEEYGKPVHPDYVHEASFIKEFDRYNINKSPKNLTNLCLRFELNPEEMMIKDIEITEMVAMLQTHFPEIHFVYTPPNAEIIVVRCYLSRGVFKKPTDMNIPFVTTIAHSIMDASVRGIPGLKNATIIEVPESVFDDDGTVSMKKMYKIKVEGVNIPGLIRNNMIDKKRIMTNSINEYTRMFGIAAGKKLLEAQLRELMPTKVSEYCYGVVSSEFSVTGEMTSADKKGIAKRELNNYLLRIAHSAPNTVITESAIRASKGPVVGLSPSLMVGRFPRIGTRYNRIAINKRFVKENAKVISEDDF